MKLRHQPVSVFRRDAMKVKWVICSLLLFAVLPGTRVIVFANHYGISNHKRMVEMTRHDHKDDENDME